MTDTGRAPRTPIDIEDAANVLWWFGDRKLGWHPGDFKEALIKAVTKADTSNRVKLLRAFPPLVTAINLIQYEKSGRAVLEELVREHNQRVAAHNSEKED